MKTTRSGIRLVLAAVAVCLICLPKSAYAKTKVSLPVKDVCTSYTQNYTYTKQGLIKKATVNGYDSRKYKYKSGRLAEVKYDGGIYTFQYKKGKLIGQKLYTDTMDTKEKSILVNYCKIKTNKKGKISKIKVYDKGKNKYYLSQIITYRYSKKGKLKEVIHKSAPNLGKSETITKVTFDSYGCVKTIKWGDLLYKYSYKRKNGRIISMTKTLNGKLRETHKYSYKTFNVKKAPKSLPFEWNAYYGEEIPLRFYQRWG